MSRKHIYFAIMAIFLVPLIGRAQEFRLAGRTVQVHGFVSQGFAQSNQNNWLTMATSRGSFEMTEGALNLSTSITDKLRIGAQVFDHNYGNLGAGHPQLDWAFADYRFASWMGVRGGKVKTTFGLYNDTQDMNFVHTWAMMPQSIYPEDLRDGLLAHEGGDLYGTISVKKAGRFAYTAFGGERRDSQYGGYTYLVHTRGLYYNDFGGPQWGGDLKWYLPLKGAMVGYSGLNESISGNGTWYRAGLPPTPVEEHAKKDQINQLYGQLSKGKFRADFEYRRYWRDQLVYNATQELKTDVRGWYPAVAYRLSKFVEVGGYYSRHSIDWHFVSNFKVEAPNQSSPDRHEYDGAITARFDIRSYLNIKAEGHFMDGYGSTMYPIGFYVQDNPSGLQPKTNSVVIRSTMYF